MSDEVTVSESDMNLQNPSEPDKTWTPIRVKRLRGRLRLSQEAFGDLVGVVRQTVAEWEQGKAKPSDLNVAALEQADSGAPTPTFTLLPQGDSAFRHGRIVGQAEAVRRMLASAIDEQDRLIGELRMAPMTADDLARIAAADKPMPETRPDAAPVKRKRGSAE